MKIIKVTSCGDCPHLRDYNWQLPEKCKLFDFIIKDTLVIDPRCKLKNKEDYETLIGTN
jgi:predicted metal-binding protein